MRGGGVTTPQQFFDPAAVDPGAGSTVLSSAPTAFEIRPVMSSTFQNGGGASRMRGGFVPSVMGAFTANAQAAIVPLAFYMVYHTFVPKSNNKSKSKSKTASATRRRRRD